MKTTIYSTKIYTQKSFEEANQFSNHELIFLNEKLSPETAKLAKDSDAVCAFVNDDLGSETLNELNKLGIKLLALRCAGYNNVDLKTAEKLNIKVVRVPKYSPYAVAEHTVALMLSLNRHLSVARARVREGNFSLEGLLGFDMKNTPVGIIGTGKIGEIVCEILTGFGCKLYAYDKFPNKRCIDLGVQYVPFDDLLSKCYIITLHCPLMPETYHLIDKNAISKMRECVMLINTSRGALIDAQAAIEGLKSHKIGYLGLDVYEEEADIFFEDLSNQIIHDDTLARLLMFPNVLVTGHQAFFTLNALNEIAKTTLRNITDFQAGNELKNEVKN